jgi:hypothetical protein
LPFLSTRETQTHMYRQARDRSRTTLTGQAGSSVPGKRKSRRESKQSEPKKPWDAGAYGRALPLAKRSAQSEWCVLWWTWMCTTHSRCSESLTTMGRKATYACEMRERGKKEDETGLVVSCRAPSYRTVCRGLVPLSLSSADPLLRGFASLLSCRINHDYASIRLFNAGLR